MTPRLEPPSQTLLPQALETEVRQARPWQEGERFSRQQLTRLSLVEVWKSALQPSGPVTSVPGQWFEASKNSLPIVNHPRYGLVYVRNGIIDSQLVPNANLPILDTEKTREAVDNAKKDGRSRLWERAIKGREQAQQLLGALAGSHGTPPSAGAPVRFTEVWERPKALTWGGYTPQQTWVGNVVGFAEPREAFRLLDASLLSREWSLFNHDLLRQVCTSPPPLRPSPWAPSPLACCRRTCRRK